MTRPCVTPMGGGGASLALTGGYALAACLSAIPHPDTIGTAGVGTDALNTALAAYQGWMRPLVDEVQNLPRWVVSVAYPQTRPGLVLRHLTDKVLTGRGWLH